MHMQMPKKILNELSPIYADEYADTYAHMYITKYSTAE